MTRWYRKIKVVSFGLTGRAFIQDDCGGIWIVRLILVGLRKWNEVYKYVERFFLGPKANFLGEENKFGWVEPDLNEG